MSGCIVVLADGVNRSNWISSATEMGLKLTEFDYIPNVLQVDCAPSDLPEILNEDCDSVEPDDLPVEIAAEQNMFIESNLSGANWGIARTIRRDKPWGNSLHFPVESSFMSNLTGDGVDYYSLDTGVLIDHVEFSGRASVIYEIYPTDGAGDDNGHGTFTASMSCGDTVGFARKSNIFSLKVLDDKNNGTNANLVSGINFLLSHYSERSNPAVVNVSIVSSSASASAAVSAMINSGLVVVACAGNKGENIDISPVYPAKSDPLVIVSGGTNMLDSVYYVDPLTNCSNWGDSVSVSAPSQFVYGATIGENGHSYRIGSGTSYGCGMVSGVVACILQGRDKLINRNQVEAIKNHIMFSATTGRLKQWSNDDNNFSPFIKLPDRILYMNPDATAPAPLDGPVSLFSSTDTAEVESGSQIYQTISSAKQGDMIIASVMHRDYITAPNGWEFVSGGQVVHPVSNYTQWLSIYHKIAQEGDAGSAPVWIQNSESRMNLFYSVFSHPYKSVYIKSSHVFDESSSGTVTGPFPHKAPAFYTSGGGNLVFAIASCIFAGGSSAWVIPDGFYLVGTSDPSVRVVGAVSERMEAGLVDVSFPHSFGSSAQLHAGVQIAIELSAI